jgi:hypothetical protein
MTSFRQFPSGLFPASLDEAFPTPPGWTFVAKKSASSCDRVGSRTHFVSFLPLALNSNLTNDGVSWTSVGAATRQGLTHSAAAPDEMDDVRVSG